MRSVLNRFIREDGENRLIEIIEEKVVKLLEKFSLSIEN